MSRDEASRIYEAVRRAAVNGAPSSVPESADVEMVAALEDGTISLDDVPEETLHRWRESLGLSEVAALLAHRQGPPAAHSAGRVPWQARRSLTWPLLLAATLLLGLVAVLLLFRDAEPKGFAFGWPARLRGGHQTASWWVPPATYLVSAKPGRNEDSIYRGPAGEGEGPWGPVYLATVRISTSARSGPVADYGLGVAISPEGWILTSYRVIERAAQSAAITGERVFAEVSFSEKDAETHVIRFGDHRRRACLYRADAHLDLALLKVEDVKDGEVLAALAVAGAAPDPDDSIFVTIGLLGQSDSQETLLRAGWLEPVAPSAGALLARDGRAPPLPVVFHCDLPLRILAGSPLVSRTGSDMNLVGLAFPCSANGPGRAAYVSRESLEGFIRNLPSREEGVPLDLLTGGLPGAMAQQPERFTGVSQELGEVWRFDFLDEESQPQALALFIDSSASGTSVSSPGPVIPKGLWGTEETGNLSFDLCLLTRRDGVRAFGQKRRDARLEEIRVDRDGNNDCDLLWLLDRDGFWKVAAPSTREPLVPWERLSAEERQVLLRVSGEVFAKE
ncbi:MAG: trypsin-like peptidase domain-containing protein [Planctomycetota bacterium]